MGKYYLWHSKLEQKFWNLNQSQHIAQEICCRASINFFFSWCNDKSFFLSRDPSVPFSEERRRLVPNLQRLRDCTARVAKSDLNSTEAYFATKNSTKKWPKNGLKLPKIAQKLAPAEKNSTDMSVASAAFCISSLPNIWPYSPLEQVFNFHYQVSVERDRRLSLGPEAHKVFQEKGRQLRIIIFLF